jgi:hypothetical protein
MQFLHRESFHIVPLRDHGFALHTCVYAFLPKRQGHPAFQVALLAVGYPEFAPKIKIGAH